MSTHLSSDMVKFREVLKSAKSVVFLSGAGISAESGIPTFRGAGGLWRKYEAAALATPGAFRNSPSLVWEFYHYRREVAAKAQPNAGHLAIANFEKKYGSEKAITVITQNVDGLHARAGTQNLIELHGNLYKTRCTKCKEVLVNTDSPICEALANRGEPDVKVVGSDIPVKSLPHCKKPGCGGLLRPHIAWFGESLEPEVLEKAGTAIESCDVCLVVGTSSVVYPAAMFAPQAAESGAIVAEFNLETTPATHDFHYYFEGPCGTTLPWALGQSRKAKRAESRLEARKARRQATDGSRPREAAEGTAKPRDAPISDALTPHVDNSPVEEKAAPKGAPSDASKPAAANASERRKPTRRGNRGKGNTTTSAKPVKRNRPDDSFTPRGEGKRSKPHPTTTSSIAYADALKSDLSVAIMVEPYHDLTKEQAEVVKRQVDGFLDEEIFAPSSSNHPYVGPAFKTTFYTEGVLKFWCKDDFSLQWLHRTTAKIGSPRPGTKLVVKRQQEIPKRVKTGLLVPQYGPNDTPDRVRRRLTCQNTHLNVSNWAVYHAEEQEEKQCLFLVLGVPEEDAEKLKASERRVHYKLGNIYARFLDNTYTPPPNPNAPGEVINDPGSGTLHLSTHQSPPQPPVPPHNTDDAKPPKINPREVPQEEGMGVDEDESGESDVDEKVMLDSDDGAASTPQQ